LLCFREIEWAELMSLGERIITMTKDNRASDNTTMVLVMTMMFDSLRIGFRMVGPDRLETWIPSTQWTTEKGRSVVMVASAHD
jgi:hypothetical protein